jgi:hypothetical protein
MLLPTTSQLLLPALCPAQPPAQPSAHLHRLHQLAAQPLQLSLPRLPLSRQSRILDPQLLKVH